jgi:hypothetical protein
MDDLQADYADFDAPPPRRRLIRAAMMLAIALSILALFAGLFIVSVIVSVARGPQFDD